MKKTGGYFGVGIYRPKTETNVGTLWRTAHILGAAFIFTIGRRYKRQSSDTTAAGNNIPLYHYETFDDFYRAMPKDCQLIGIELDEKSEKICGFKHPKRCTYILGAEDDGIPKGVLDKCHKIVQLPGEMCLNVAVAGSIVIYDRVNKG